ncbi:ferritin-like domain-containing protein [Pantoea stewartii]|uniref:YciE/YciF ferroxidase family protein n=1 Tax=Pantoea stewartii TaxID=66269 RepID=UPI00197F1236
MKVKTLLDLFIHNLSDVYSAEKQISRLDQIIDARDKRRIVHLKCHALEGLVADALELIESTEAGAVRDAGITGAAQKVEHCEIAACGTRIALVSPLGLKEASQRRADRLEEKKSTDVKLS